MSDASDDLDLRLTVIERLLTVAFAEQAERAGVDPTAYLEAVRAGAADALAWGMRAGDPAQRDRRDRMLQQVDRLMDAAQALQAARQQVRSRRRRPE